MKITLKSYLIGFILSVIFTLGASALIWIHMHSGHTVFSHSFLFVAILILAVLQLIIQLVFFMHLGSESGPRLKLAALASTVGIVLIVIIGSVWIMTHLNYNMMASPTDMNAYIQSQDGF